MKSSLLVFSVVSSMLFAAGALAADSIGEPGRDSGNKNPLKNVYFGEEHMHTRNSFDAVSIGVRQTWEDAYRCKGTDFTLSWQVISIGFENAV